MSAPIDVSQAQLQPYYESGAGRRAATQSMFDMAANPACVLTAMRAAGFADVYCKVDMGIFREYVGTKK
jgi:hypothetical protein